VHNADRELTFLAVELSELVGHTAFLEKVAVAVSALKSNPRVSPEGVAVLAVPTRDTDLDWDDANPGQLFELQATSQSELLGVLSPLALRVPIFVAVPQRELIGGLGYVLCWLQTLGWLMRLGARRILVKSLAKLIFETKVGGVQVGSYVLSEGLRTKYSVNSKGKVRFSLVFPRIFLNLLLAKRALDRASIPENSYFLAPDPTYSCEGVARLASRRHGTGRFIFSLAGSLLVTPPETSFQVAKELEPLLWIDHQELPPVDDGLGMARVHARLRDNSWVDLAYVPFESAEALALAEETPISAESRAAVVFLHDFADAEFLTGWSGFESHFQWAFDTLTTLLEADAYLELVVKVHPTEVFRRRLGASFNSALDQLKATFAGSTRIRWVDSPASTLQIVRAFSPVFAVTLYGTIAEELAVLRVPVIASSTALYGNYKIANTSDTRDSFRALLRTACRNPKGLHLAEKDELARYLDLKYGRPDCGVLSLQRRFERETQPSAASGRSDFLGWIMSQKLPCHPISAGLS